MCWGFISLYILIISPFIHTLPRVKIRFNGGNIMDLYVEIFKTSLTSGFTSIMTALASVALLYASQLITTGDGDYHLPGMGYKFNEVNYKGAFLMGGIYGFLFLQVIPLLFTTGPVVSWVPVLIIALLVTQSMIDLKYKELSNEWSFVIGLLLMYWGHLNQSFTVTNLYIAIIVLLGMFISWVFTGLPGLGDVKLLFVGAIILNNWVSAYHFVLLVMVLSLVFISLHAIINKVPFKEWWSLNFPMGPYIAIGIISAMVGII